MNLHNALGFSALGLVMKFLPGHFSATIGTGFSDSARGLWLAVMSIVIMTIPATWFAHKAFSLLRARWTWASSSLAARRTAASASVQAAGSRARFSA